MKTIIMAVPLLVGSTAVWSQQISCGEVPKIQRSVEQKLKGDVEGKAQLLTKILGNADVQGTVDTSKTELYQQHQDVGRDEIDLYFAWISCQTILLDRTMSSGEKIGQWMAVYKALLGRGLSRSAAAGETTEVPKASIDSSVLFVNGIKFAVKRLVPSANGQVTLILSVLNINDGPTKLALLAPYPTLTDDNGNAGIFTGTEGIQLCNLATAVDCVRQSTSLFVAQPNFSVNVVVRFRLDANNLKPTSASFNSRLLIANTDRASDPTVVSLAFPDIPFK